jgi:hypothetical protein
LGGHSAGNENSLLYSVEETVAMHADFTEFSAYSQEYCERSSVTSQFPTVSSNEFNASVDWY